MIAIQKAFSGFSVDNIDNTKNFYEKILGISAEKTDMGLILHLPGGEQVFIYQKDTHQPASYTVLNFVVSRIDEAVDELIKEGVKFEKYEGFHQDEKGIARGIAAHMGPDIAWFKDPAGNILSVLQENENA